MPPPDVIHAHPQTMNQPSSSSSSPASDGPKPPMDLSHHLSVITRNRPMSKIKDFYKYFAIPGIGQLAGGLPAAENFPFDTLEAQVALPERWKPTPNDPVDPPSEKLSSLSLKSPLPSSRILVPGDSNVSDMMRKIDVASALQYCPVQGYPALYTFLHQFTRDHMHPNIPYAGGPDIVFTTGSTDGFSKCITAFLDDWIEGRDPISKKGGLLVEHFAYMNAAQTAAPHGVNVVPVTIDAEGMLASGRGGLEDVLENWDYSRGARPHLMYTVSMGQNPTSGVLSVPRRKEIYALCSKYDVLIIEDEPYWYLQYPSATALSTPPKPEKSSGFAFLDSLVPSYLSVDTDGRVVRLDTFSKTIAPGCRLGWITAQPLFVERLLRISETSTQAPSGFIQAMIGELLMGPQTPTDPGRGGKKDGSGWDVSGWVRWLEGLRGNYERRMNLMSDVLDKGKYAVKSGRRRSLAQIADGSEDEDEWTVIEKTPLYSFERPMGGMFLWMRFNFESHPLFKDFPITKLSRAFWLALTKPPYLVLVTPGFVFSPTQEIMEKEGWYYYRLCFAAVPHEDVAPLSKRFVEGVQAFWRIKSKQDIEDLLDEGTASTGMVGDGLDDLRGMMGPCC